jgi:serine/threonine protein kinase/Tol biopolymer transport system component
LPLIPGSRLGPYEILAAIGAGGMGEVYRAADSNLKRSVAIKVLPVAMASDADRLARFQREAELLAALNHPNIGAIYGLEKTPDFTALVMELVEGEDLSQRIAKGAIPIDEALPIARQIVDALETAHEQGIIHRDLKPANIKVRADGTVKVLDFGLAKAMESGSGIGERRSISLSPTITSPAMTQSGVILGTAAYMSPEQARGKPVDRRADIWAFGCVLFEMLAGRRPFGGDEVPDVLANVLAREPDWGALPAGTPASLRRLIVRCLMKDPRQRLHDIADARLELQDALAGPSVDEVAATSAQKPKPASWLMPSLIIGVVALVGGLVAGAAMWRRSAPPVSVVRLTLDSSSADEVGTGSTLDMLPAGGRLALAWAPSGQTLAFIGSNRGVQQVYLRDLASGEARGLDGTQGAQAFAYSSDGAWLVFWTGTELRKIRISGGPSARICDAIQVTGLTWGPTRVVFTTRYQVFEVSPDGGTARALTEPDKRRSTPFLLPGENALLYSEYGKPFTSGDEQVMIRGLVGGAQPQVLLSEAADARYIPTGHLVFMRQGTLFVVGFDADTLMLRGSPVAIVSDVAQSAAAWFADDLTLSGQFAVSPEGMLAYVPSPSVSLPMADLVRVNRSGEVSAVGAPPNTYRERVEVSPDGTTLAVTVQSTTDVRLFLFDVTRGTLAPAFPQQAQRDTIRPIWAATGQIAMQVYRSGGSHLALLASDRGGVTEEPLLPQNGFAPSSWLRKGEALIGHRGGNLWVYKPAASGEKWTQLTDSVALERYPVWSPDGSWLAYASDVSGRDEVYVQPYPGPGSPVLVSTAGGLAPVWNPNGRELIYTESVAGTQTDPSQQRYRVMAAPMVDPRRPGKPRQLFENINEVLPLNQCASTPCYSVSPDGQSFYTLQFRPREIPRVKSLRLILNWFDDVRRLAPAN